VQALVTGMWKRFRTKRNFRADYYDYGLLTSVILLTGFGLVILYSATAYTSQVRYGNDLHFFGKQAGISALALIGAVILSMILDYHILWKAGGMLYILSLVLVMLTKSPLGKTVNGARRWINLGQLSFQPAELAKIAVIVYIPIWIVKMGRKYKGVKAIIFPLCLGAVQSLCVCFFTQNLSTAIIILGIAVTIIFIAHPNTKAFLIAAAIIVAFVAFCVWLIGTHEIGGSFRFSRIQVWLHPEKYSSSGGYQILQALYAIGSGGLLGKGLGNSTQKLGAVPEAENDMIFSIICEELGIVGGIIVVLLFIYLLYRLFIIAQNAPDLYGSLIVTGIFAHIALQVILNISVVLNLIPTTGVTLPFVSYGGTSVVFLMLEMAIALSVSMRIRFREARPNLWGEIADEVRESS
jgi:cell division protein FtsW